MRASACLVLLLVATGAWAGETKFEPALADRFPIVTEQFDPLLLAAGKPADRWARAQTLREGLAPAGEVDPLGQNETWVRWLAITAMVESAVADTPEPPEEWELQLLGLYRSLASAEPGYRALGGAVRLLMLQHGQAAAPLQQLVTQAVGLSAYCRAGIRWLAGQRLPAKPSPELRRALLAGLVEVERREMRWAAMRRAATSLADLGGEPADQALVAEAAFELGDLDAGRAALAKARGKAPAEAVEMAAGRLELAEAKAALVRKAGGPEQTRVARALARLNEPWRIKARFSADRVVALASPELDGIYMDALLDDGFDYRAAWAFGRRAKGAPPSAAFIGRRIGAGLAVLLEGLLGQEKRIDEPVRAAIRSDLKRLGNIDARLATLTDLYLRFLGALAGQDVDALAAELAQPVEAFVAAHPTDADGLQLAFLIGQLTAKAPTPWKVVQRYKKAGGKTDGPFGALYASAAVRQAIQVNDRGPVSEVLGWLEGQPGLAENGAHLLWRAHLLATRGLLAEGPAQAAQLQRAVQAYGQTLEAWGAGKLDRDPAVLCAASVSLASLMMQAQGLEQAKGLLTQTAPVCEADPDHVGVAAVIDLATGSEAEAGQASAVERLAKVADQLSSRSAQIQARLWLGLVAEAAGDTTGAQAHFRQAARDLAAERARGAPAVLAPDLRSLVALSGQFQMGTGHATDSPFGLVLSISVQTRMVLFPPAAVGVEQISKYQKKKDK